jgi:hypothetical protein
MAIVRVSSDIVYVCASGTSDCCGRTRTTTSTECLPLLFNMLVGGGNVNSDSGWFSGRTWLSSGRREMRSLRFAIDHNHHDQVK